MWKRQPGAPTYAIIPAFFLLHQFLPIHRLRNEWRSQDRYTLMEFSHATGTISGCHLIGTGSKFENLYVPNYQMKNGVQSVVPDDDFMVVHPELDFDTEEHDEDPNVHCGYLRPYHLPQTAGTDRSYIREIPFSPSMISGLDNKTHGDYIQNMKKPDEMGQHGPAHFYGWGEKENEYVITLPCPTWPDAAAEWLTRIRPSRWPPTDLVDLVRRQGCHVVKVAHPKSVRPDIEWRYSFSLAELTLAQFLNDTQKQCYIIAKALFKQTRHHGSSLKTYHLKTVLLWCSEKLPRRCWTKENLAACFIYLIDQFLEYLTRRKIPQYFIPDNNLIDHIPMESLRRDICQFVRLRTSPTDGISEWDSKHQFTDISQISPDIRSLLVKSVTDEGHEVLMTKKLLGGMIVTAIQYIVDIFLIMKHVGVALDELAVWQGLVAYPDNPLSYLMERIKQKWCDGSSDFSTIAQARAAELFSIEVYQNHLEAKTKQALEKVINGSRNAARYANSVPRSVILPSLANIMYRYGMYGDAILYADEAIKIVQQGNVGDADLCPAITFSPCMINILDDNLQKELLTQKVEIRIPFVLYAMYIKLMSACKLHRRVNKEDVIQKCNAECKQFTMKRTSQKDGLFGYTLLGYVHMAFNDYISAIDAFSFAYRFISFPLNPANVALALLFFALKFSGDNHYKLLPLELRRLLQHLNMRILKLCIYAHTRVSLLTKASQSDRRFYILENLTAYGQAGLRAPGNFRHQISSAMIDFAYVCSMASKNTHNYLFAVDLKSQAATMYAAVIKVSNENNVAPLTEYANFLYNEGQHMNALGYLKTVSHHCLGNIVSVRCEVPFLDEDLRRHISSEEPLVLPYLEYCLFLMVKIYSQSQQKQMAATVISDLCKLCKYRPVTEMEGYMLDRCVEEIKSENARKCECNILTVSKPPTLFRAYSDPSPFEDHNKDIRFRSQVMVWKFILLGYAHLCLDKSAEASAAFSNALRFDPCRRSLQQWVDTSDATSIAVDSKNEYALDK